MSIASLLELLTSMPAAGWTRTAPVLLLFALIGMGLRRAWLELPARALTPRLSRLVSAIMRARECGEDEFLTADGAPLEFKDARRAGLAALRARLTARSPLSHAWAERVRTGLSDLRFTDASRVPFPFARIMREGFNVAAVATASTGSRLRDLDDNWNIDVSGSYGVNLAGYDRYKEWLDRGWARVRDLGPVLGPLHPVVSDNVTTLKSIAGLDEVSFHASGTEAVMAAARRVRFNTRRKLIVCFAGAYHGWWDGVQPGLGSERGIDDCLTLKDMKPASLALIRARAGDIAGVLVNPVQSFHPNAPPPNDAILLNSSVRRTAADSAPYGQWLRELRAACSAADVPLIFDEVFSGFRLAPGGAQAYFGVQADMVVYGKTVAGGMPIGVVCGRRELMRRYDPTHPLRLAYVVGTFAAHPLTMGAMREFLDWVTTAAAAAEYADIDQRTRAWVARSNREFDAAGLPIQVTHLGTLWTLQFGIPSRFNWLLQYYLRAEGINLSWVGTGRCMFNIDFSDTDFSDLTAKISAAATRMLADKWWLDEREHPHRARDVQARVTRDLVKSMLQPPRALQGFYRDVMQRKHDDHEASHSHGINQFLHLVSSSVFIFCYWLVFSDRVTAMWLGLAALFVRQMGHALIEPPCHAKEQLLLGFDTRSKTRVVGIYLLIPVLNCLATPVLDAAAGPHIIRAVGEQWFAFTALVVLGHVARLTPRHGFRNAMIWFVKLITDPLTDIVAYSPTLLRLRTRH